MPATYSLVIFKMLMQRLFVPLFPGTRLTSIQFLSPLSLSFLWKPPPCAPFSYVLKSHPFSLVGFSLETNSNTSITISASSLNNGLHQFSEHKVTKEAPIFKRLFSPVLFPSQPVPQSRAATSMQRWVWPNHLCQTSPFLLAPQLHPGSSEASPTD